MVNWIKCHTTPLLFSFLICTSWHSGSRLYMSSATLDLSEVFTPVTRSSTLGMSQDERATAVNVHVLCLISLLLSSSSMWGSRSSQASPIKSLILSDLSCNILRILQGWLDAGALPPQRWL